MRAQQKKNAPVTETGGIAWTTLFSLSIKVSFEFEIFESLTSIACSYPTLGVFISLFSVETPKKNIWRDLSVVIRANEERGSGWNNAHWPPTRIQQTTIAFELTEPNKQL